MTSLCKGLQCPFPPWRLQLVLDGGQPLWFQCALPALNSTGGTLAVPRPNLLQSERLPCRAAICTFHHDVQVLADVVFCPCRPSQICLWLLCVTSPSRRHAQSSKVPALTPLMKLLSRSRRHRPSTHQQIHIGQETPALRPFVQPTDHGRNDSLAKRSCDGCEFL